MNSEMVYYCYELSTLNMIALLYFFYFTCRFVSKNALLYNAYHRDLCFISN